MDIKHTLPNAVRGLLPLAAFALAILLCMTLAPRQAIAADMLRLHAGNSLTASVAAADAAIATQAKTKTVTLYAKSATKASAKLKASGLKASKAKWKSSKPKVAKVSAKGKVTALKTGKATITAKQGKKSFKFKIVVKNVKINKKKASLEPGGKVALKLVGDALKSAKSSSTKVATVTKKGVVKAKAPGTATITLISKKGKKLTCKVTVAAVPTDDGSADDASDENVPVESVAFSNSALTLEEGGEVEYNPAFVYPDYATDRRITYTTSNPEVATVDADGIVTSVGSGSATITATASNGMKATCTVTVKPELRIVGVQDNAAITRASIDNEAYEITIFGPDPSFDALDGQIMPILNRADVSYDIRLDADGDYCSGTIELFSDEKIFCTYSVRSAKEWYGMEIVSFETNDIVSKYSIDGDKITVFVRNSDPAVYLPNIVANLGRPSASYEVRFDEWGFPMIEITDGDESRLLDITVSRDWEGLDVRYVYGGKDIEYAGRVFTTAEMVDGGRLQFETDLDGVDLNTFNAQGFEFDFDYAVQSHSVFWDEAAESMMLEIGDREGRSRRIPIEFSSASEEEDLPHITSWNDESLYEDHSIYGHTYYESRRAYWALEMTQVVRTSSDQHCTVDQVKEWIDPVPSEGCTGEWSKLADGQWIYTATRTSDGATRVYHLKLRYE